MPIPPNNSYWFVLGRESLMAAAEIDAVLNLQAHQYSPQILKVQADFEPKLLIKRLGGTIKIAKEMAASVGEQDLKTAIIEELKTVEGKINFGLSVYSQANIDLREVKKLGLEIKKQLKTVGYSVRYVENKEAALSSVTVEKNGLTNRGREFLIEKGPNDKFSLAKTEAVQPFEEFSARDFGRPGRDDVSGMLPPKLAMIMVNLAKVAPDSILLDPFCGSGTILSEAVLLGYKNLIGSDISEKAVADTKRNIDWTAEKFKIDNKTFKTELHVSGVENLSSLISAQSADAIVAEPYLGKPLRGQETKEDLLKQVNELKKLYLAAFVQFQKILKPKGRAVFLIPRFKFKNDWITIDCKNEIEKTGFKILPFFENKMPLLYARPDQRVGREIWRFEKK